MSIAYLDTNVFIRFLTNDDAAQSPRAYMLFKEVESGTRTVTTADLVIAEIVHILSSGRLYNRPRQEIRDKLRGVLSLKGLKLKNKGALNQALGLYATTNIDFVDAYLAVSAQTRNVAVISFDKHFDHISGLTREEP